jgi:hypothetical protein
MLSEFNFPDIFPQFISNFFKLLRLRMLKGHFRTRIKRKQTNFQSVKIELKTY